MSLFFLSKHIDFQKISFCSTPQGIELSAKHRSRSKARLSTMWSLKDLTIVLDWRLPHARVTCHHPLCVSQRIVELCFPHNTHSFWTQQTMNQIAVTLSNSLSPLPSVFLSFNLLSGCNYLLQEKWLVLSYFIHMQKILQWEDPLSHLNLSKKSP